MASSARAAGTAVFIITVILQAQLFAIEQPPSGKRTYTPTGYLVKETRRMVSISPMQGAAVSLLTINPELLPVTKALLMPGTFYRVLVKEVFDCFNGKGCRPAVVFDFPAMWDFSDISHLQPAFMHAFKKNAGWAQTACGLISISAITLMVSPGKGLMGGLGMALLFYCLMSESATTEMQPPLLLMALMAGYAAWNETSDSRQATADKAASTARKAERAEAKKAPAVASPKPKAGAKATTPPSPGPVKKKTRT